jgi:hypothetical protein
MREIVDEAIKRWFLVVPLTITFLREIFSVGKEHG